MQQENIFEIKLSRGKDNTTRNIFEIKLSIDKQKQYNKEIYLK